MTGDIFYENNIEDVYHQQVQDMESTLSLNYTVLLCEQLEQQQKYFENKIKEIKETKNKEVNEKLDQNLCAMSEKNQALRDEIEDLERNDKLNHKKYRKFESKINHIHKEISELEEDKSRYQKHLATLTKDEKTNNSEDVQLQKLESEILKETKLLEDLGQKLSTLYEHISSSG